MSRAPTNFVFNAGDGFDEYWRKVASQMSGADTPAAKNLAETNWREGRSHVMRSLKTYNAPRADALRDALPSSRLECALREKIRVMSEALRRAKGFIANGIELGYIRMPDKDCPDPAHDTPRIIDEALACAASEGHDSGGLQPMGIWRCTAKPCGARFRDMASRLQAPTCPECGCPAVFEGSERNSSMQQEVLPDTDRQSNECPACGSKDTETGFDGLTAFLHCVACGSDTAWFVMMDINNAIAKGRRAEPPNRKCSAHPLARLGEPYDCTNCTEHGCPTPSKWPGCYSPAPKTNSPACGTKRPNCGVWCNAMGGSVSQVCEDCPEANSIHAGDTTK